MSASSDLSDAELVGMLRATGRATRANRRMRVEPIVIERLVTEVRRVRAELERLNTCWKCECTLLPQLYDPVNPPYCESCGAYDPSEDGPLPIP